MHTTFGPIALLGSGETALAGGRVFENIASRLQAPLRISILETPAGFELNSAQVAGRVAEFLRVRLQNFHPQISVIPARKLGTAFSPEDATLIAPLLDADLIFMGPGSPTYAVRQLKDTLAWELIRARHRLGAALVFASAATIAVGARTLPVYEIYKVGEEISCPPGLDLFADFGLALSCIPHWNNTDGGDDVDTSRCFMGMDRFHQWCDLLPPGHTTLGLDEHTGIIIDFEAGTCTVTGVSSVTLLRQCAPQIHPSGTTFLVEELGTVRCPKYPQDGIAAAAWEMAIQAFKDSETHPADTAPLVPTEVQIKVDQRLDARAHKDWALSDLLRNEIEALGWRVIDTPGGTKVVRQVF